jgi:hypothetical protein
MSVAVLRAAVLGLASIRTWRISTNNLGRNALGYAVPLWSDAPAQRGISHQIQRRRGDPSAPAESHTQPFRLPVRHMAMTPRNPALCFGARTPTAPGRIRRDARLQSGAKAASMSLPNACLHGITFRYNLTAYYL